MGIIFLNEWKGLLRNRLFIFLSIFFMLLLVIATFFGVVQKNTQNQSQKDAHSHIRLQWDTMDPTNPHSAAHFGTYAFKPISPLSSIDDGINSVTGVVLRLEGHKQNEISYSEASQSIFISQFGKFKSSLLLQFVIPLFLIFLAFNSYMSEIVNKRLKLIIIQGSSLNKLLFGKILCIFSFGLILLLLTVFVQIFFNFTDLEVDDIFRLSILLLSYIFYYFIVISVTILLSVIFQNSTTSLSLSIITWMLWTIFLPKIIGDVVEQVSPLPTRFEIKENMSLDRSKGIDGHNPLDKRKKDLENKILKEYNVDSLKQLPINFAGIVMQADEEYGNKVWDKHYGELYNKLNLQKKYFQFSGLINPFISVRNLSMGASGTDLAHHIDFLKKAEIYRRYFIKTLNDEYAYGGSKTGERGWKANNNFFRSIKDFDYPRISFSSILSQYIIDILYLFLWSISLILLILFFSKKTLIELQ